MVQDQPPILDRDQTSVTRTVTFLRCLRCEFEWLPKASNPQPKRCPNCTSSLWNVPRANKWEGAPPPTRRGKPRGVAFGKGDENPQRKARKEAEEA